MTVDAVGGVWTYALDLAEELAGQGLRITLAVLGPDPSTHQTERALRIPGLDLRCTGLPLDWLAGDSQSVLAAGLEIARLAEAVEADLVHLNSPALAASGAFTQPVVSVCHSCVATWWDAVRGGALPEDFAWRTALVAQGYAASDRLVAPTRAFARDTARLYRLPGIPAAVWNGRRPTPARDNQAAPADFIFTHGRLWDEGKNLGALDRMAARLNIPVLAAGPQAGPNGAFQELHHIRPLGLLSEAQIAGWLRQQPVFASLALYEPFGLAVLEAAQAGCPLILADRPGFRELWDGAAIFVPAEDEARIAAILTEVFADGGERRRLGALARDRAGRYSVTAMATSMLDIYRSMARQAAPKREVAAP